MKRLTILFLLLAGCGNATAPDYRVLSVRCTLYQTPAGVVYDACR